MRVYTSNSREVPQVDRASAATPTTTLGGWAPKSRVSFPLTILVQWTPATKLIFSVFALSELALAARANV